ncbi:MAG: acyl-CoA dehydrogenase family protein, partial [Pseudomonadota bacterium]|nr:acyl-CoA dehydrogenase family protein [Pseudomonadota bacterium]
MIPYTPPLADMRFVLSRLVGLERLAALPGHESLNGELVDAVLEEAAKIAAEQFAPLNRSGDLDGARLESGKVRLPEGFRAAYKAFADGGWNGLPVATELGGQGLPWSLSMPVQEMLQSANVSLSLCGLLTQGAIEALAAHGSDELKRRFLPKLVSGEWTGTMNLTEPQAGSDVGAVRCRASPADDPLWGDHYRITGQKIFISYGDHDLTDNILHLVLARLPDAPEGTKGLSLFLVPKILVKADGTMGTPNDVRTVSIEHKLGLHGSPTCVMAYGDGGGAVGYLVGAEHGGMAAMFTMMNNARVGVGLQGLAVMERAYQQAVEIAKNRIQGRELNKPKGSSVAIIRHPDVRRMLLGMKASIEAARALAYMCAFSTDVEKCTADAKQREAAAARADLLTPVVKAWLTDLANEVTSTAVQVAGGMGYIEETGLAQHMRDARVFAIYEGTNGIQSNDLVFRKIARDGGAAFGALIDEMVRFLPGLAGLPGDDGAVMHKHFSRAVMN